MKILLTGATGFIGGHILRALLEQKHEVTCLIRRRASHNLRQLLATRIIEGEWTIPEPWLQHIAGHDVVINTVGIIRQMRAASFEAVHTHAPVVLFDTAAQAGVQKIIQISAMGADHAAATRYHLSKRAADEYLANLGVPFVVLRPSFVYGPGDHSMSFFSRLAALPLTPVPGDGQYRIQPLFIGDLTRAVLAAIERPELKITTVDIGGSQVLAFNDLLDVLARIQGKPQGARKAHIPWPIMRLVAAVTDSLGGRGPITGEELQMLQRGSFGDNTPFIAQFGFEPVAFEAGVTLQNVEYSSKGLRK